MRSLAVRHQVSRQRAAGPGYRPGCPVAGGAADRFHVGLCLASKCERRSSMQCTGRLKRQCQAAGKNFFCAVLMSAGAAILFSGRPTTKVSGFPSAISGRMSAQSGNAIARGSSTLSGSARQVSVWPTATPIFLCRNQRQWRVAVLPSACRLAGQQRRSMPRLRAAAAENASSLAARTGYCGSARQLSDTLSTIPVQLPLHPSGNTQESALRGPMPWAVDENVAEVGQLHRTPRIHAGFPLFRGPGATTKPLGCTGAVIDRKLATLPGLSLTVGCTRSSMSASCRSLGWLMTRPRPIFVGSHR